MYNSTIPVGDDDSGGEEAAAGSKLTEKPNGITEVLEEASSTIRNSVQITEEAMEVSSQETSEHPSPPLIKSTVSPSVAEENSNQQQPLTFEDVPIKAENFSSTLGVYQNCAVCSDREVCSQIGR